MLKGAPHIPWPTTEVGPPICSGFDAQCKTTHSGHNRYAWKTPRSHKKATFSHSLKNLYSWLVLCRYSASVVVALAYGINAKSYDDPLVKSVIQCLTRLGNNLRPGLWKVDAYPFLRLFVRPLMYLLINSFLQQVHPRVLEGAARRSRWRVEPL